jgi:uncharacterized membrane protein YtjA (UPF0391 family)
MLKRAYISAVIAVLSAMFGFSGLLDGAAPIAKAIAYAFGAFCGLSLLFSLFEDAEEAPVVEGGVELTPQLVFNFPAEKPILAPVHV